MIIKKELAFLTALINWGMFLDVSSMMSANII